MTAKSFVVRPHADNLHSPFRVEHLIDKAMLNVDAPGEGAGEIPDHFSNGGELP